jgi:hypothetical protein
MKKILTIIVLLSVTLGFGQTAIKKSSLSTGGGSNTVGNYTLIYAIGEVAVQENTVGSAHLSEGFIGPDIYVANGIEDYGHLQGVSVFPNPVINDMHLLLPEANDYEILIFDLTGKEVMHRNESFETENLIDLSGFKTGVYMLIVIDRNSKQQATFKITKA